MILKKISINYIISFKFKTLKKDKLPEILEFKVIFLNSLIKEIFKN